MESSGFTTERNKKKKKTNSSSKKTTERGEEEIWPRKNKVTLEGTIESIDQGSGSGGISGNNSNTSSSAARTKSLTDEDLEELKGCLDLGFGFSYEEIPELCNTLPALELCYSMSQRFLDDSSCCSEDSSSTALTRSSSSSSSSSAQVANWKIASPGDHPDEVKARLRYWAQAVACTVRLCAEDAK